MAINITPVTYHRGREKGMLVYPVYSRRSAGLSIGINLFPDKKNCPFDCPYCEVFPFSSCAQFSLEQMESDLHSAIMSAQEQNIPIKDICFSGNGEPTLSPIFPAALKSAETIRAKTASSAQLVTISNGAGLLQPQIFSLLKEMSANSAFNLWLKVDAGTQDWYQKMNRSSLPFDELTAKKKEFAELAVFTIQTMLCAINGEQPPETEKTAWEKIVTELAANGNVRKVQLYGKARCAPEDPLASELPAEYLENRASSLRTAFAEKGITAPVEIYL
jgi:histidinol dehydrogenase